MRRPSTRTKPFAAISLLLVAACANGNDLGSPPVDNVTEAVTTITIGQTSILPSGDTNNGNYLLAQQATLGQTATIQSLSFYVTTAGGNLRLGIYDATGPGGGPGVKKAETNSFTPGTGWNTQNVVTPVSLAA